MYTPFYIGFNWKYGPYAQFRYWTLVSDPSPNKVVQKGEKWSHKIAETSLSQKELYKVHSYRNATKAFPAWISKINNKCQRYSDWLCWQWKLLGVRIDNSLQYTKHVDDVCRSLASKLAFLNIYLYNTGNFISMHIPSLDYCLRIWGNAPITHLDRILKFQKYAALIILDAPPDSPSQPLFKELGWLTIFQRIHYNKGVLLYKSVHGMCSEYMSEMFTFSNSQTYNLRSIDNFDMVIPKHNKEIFKNSLQYAGVQIWNNLPVTLRTASSLSAFKYGIYNFIMSNRP